ncbi:MULTISPECIES: metal ABC transporter ATP-binding protein [unclassified Pseudodesulfovibrio]|uniref:metal ABC transporter ATP-binding protein n=1 Tax=unclassified Pseudodesulfovibrio TaxID=2661612 RepID=UPI000FEB689C|nr:MULTISPECIES: metal ABC transporter ATP-binding protein [unclassified Pseudodesulfovibrio]MCJ2163360.1 metal ABC transporter ATP-binding protein [Pseudodesulfovibrio sp. S3-i]RWU06599.1 metal ABC transporter ATP-binding protein [Pseudodesulfovibrio sp. S3]
MTGVMNADRGPRIHFENVGLELGGNSILHGVNFTVNQGSIHGIIGPNGGGKTSLVRCMLGQMPHSGTIRICWDRKGAVGYVPQSLDFDDTLPMTVLDFMGMVRQGRCPVFFGIKSQVRSDIRRVLDVVGMADKMDRPFGALSGGERQRVLLAQALMPEPKLLVLDEPVTGLDRSGSSIMHHLLKELSASGTTVVVVHHDLAMVKYMAQSVTCINREVLFSGDPGVELTPERLLDIFSTSVKAA